MRRKANAEKSEQNKNPKSVYLFQDESMGKYRLNLRKQKNPGNPFKKENQGFPVSTLPYTHYIDIHQNGKRYDPG